MASARISSGRTIAAHAVLLTYTLIALFPVFVIVINSFKSRKAIFADPLALPLPGNFDWVGYETVLKQGDFSSAPWPPSPCLNTASGATR